MTPYWIPEQVRDEEGMAKARCDIAKTAAEIDKIKSETFENVTDAARNVAGLRGGSSGLHWLM